MHPPDRASGQGEHVLRRGGRDVAALECARDGGERLPSHRLDGHVGAPAARGGAHRAQPIAKSPREAATAADETRGNGEARWTTPRRPIRARWHGHGSASPGTTGAQALGCRGEKSYLNRERGREDVRDQLYTNYEPSPQRRAAWLPKLHQSSQLRGVSVVALRLHRVPRAPRRGAPVQSSRCVNVRKD